MNYLDFYYFKHFPVLFNCDIIHLSLEICFNERKPTVEIIAYIKYFRFIFSYYILFVLLL